MNREESINMKRTKISVLGGGSVFTPELVALLGTYSEDLGDVDLYLMDLQADRLKVVGDFCQRLLEGKTTSIILHMTTDLQEAIRGADYICNQIRSGGLPARIEDERLGKRYKLPFTETVSVCGFATYLRSFPDIVKIANVIKNEAPEAWILNFANPAGMLSETFFRLGINRVIGVCNVSEKIKDFFAERLGIARDLLYMNFRGINHMTFVDQVWVNGEDRYGEVIKNYNKGDSTLPFSSELIQDLGFVPSPYLQYYYLKDKIVEKLQDQNKNRSELVLEIEKELLNTYKDAIEIPVVLKKRGGYGYSKVVANLIRDMFIDGGNIHYAIVRNGSTLTEIPENGFVEVPVIAHKNRVEAIQVDPIPVMAKPLVVSLKAYEDMLIDGALNRNEEQLLRSLVMHPLIPSYGIAKDLLEDVLKINQPYLDWLK
jgi:6-phospho-beta-glucosidase